MFLWKSFHGPQIQLGGGIKPNSSLCCQPQADIIFNFQKIFCYQPVIDSMQLQAQTLKNLGTTMYI